MKVDLQLHSTYSDGQLTPTALAKFIAKQGVKAAALTDHNTIGGWDEFAAACHKLKMKPILGLELYVRLGARQLNLLWYNFDSANEALHKLLHETQARRRASLRRFFKKLSRHGLKLDLEKILDQERHYVPINRLIDELLAVPGNLAKIKHDLKNDQPREDEIIRHYFYNQHFGILHESCINLARIIKLKKQIGGQLILAHPGKNGQLELELLIKLKNIGLDGVEVLSPHHSLSSVMHAQHLVARLNLIASGGSDYHRSENSRFLQNCYDYWQAESRFLPGVDRIIK